LSVPVSTLLMVVTRKIAEFKAQNDLAGIGGLYRRINNRVLVAGFFALVVFVLCASPIQSYLHVPAVMPVILLGVLIFTTLPYPVNMAVLQGVQDYTWININQGLAGPAKFIFAVGFVLVGFRVNGVMAGLILTSLVLWLSSFYPIRGFALNRDRAAASPDRIAFAEVLPIFFAVFAFAVLTQADMVLVRRYFLPHDTGLYASAAILGKAVMYVPGAVVLAMFPMVSEQRALNQSSRHVLAKSIAITLALSGAGALLFFLCPGWIMRTVYGVRYSEAQSVLKYYGVAMLPMALLMVLMQYLIARKKSLFSYIMIVGGGLEIAAISLMHRSLLQVVFTMLVVGAALFGVGVAIQYVPSLQSESPATREA
ncbi:MAG TPA: hypothetical protein P5079_11330, partial [Elusimicrobiota bacterium]|nr:hypothetical protein [Elusimicrobiota bacterium]